MRRAASCFLLLIGSWMFLRAGHCAESDAAQVETLWRGTLGQDSLFVRATWRPTAGDATCMALAGGSLEDSTAVLPQYLTYEIVHSALRVRWRDLVSGEEFGMCCSQLSADGTPWADGVVLAVSDEVWPCEPAGSCGFTRYIYLSRAGAVAASGWGWVDWDPAKPELISGTTTMDCIEYEMTLQPRVAGHVLSFEPRFPQSVHAGDLIEEPVGDFYCNRQAPTTSVAVELFQTSNAVSPDVISIEPGDPVEIVSVVVRAEADPRGGLRPRAVRYGIHYRDRKGYVTLTSLRQLGFLFSLDVIDREHK